MFYEKKGNDYLLRLEKGGRSFKKYFKALSK